MFALLLMIIMVIYVKNNDFEVPKISNPIFPPIFDCNLVQIHYLTHICILILFALSFLRYPANIPFNSLFL
jgi:hypothetical protein